MNLWAIHFIICYLCFSVPDPWDFSGRICANCERNMYHQKTSKRAKVISNKDVNIFHGDLVYILLMSDVKVKGSNNPQKTLQETSSLVPQQKKT